MIADFIRKKKKLFDNLFNLKYFKKCKKEIIAKNYFLTSINFGTHSYLWYRFLNFIKLSIEEKFLFLFYFVLEFKKLWNYNRYFSVKFRKKTIYKPNKLIAYFNFENYSKIENIIFKNFSIIAVFNANLTKKKKKIFLKKNLLSFNCFDKYLCEKKKKSFSIIYFNKKNANKKKNNFKNSNIKKEFFSLFPKKKRPIVSMSILFKNSLSEFIQIKGIFDFKSTRIKNFTLIWDETIWISKIFKFKRNDKYLNLSNEIFLFLLFIFTNTCDFCTLCLSQKKFLKNVLISEKNGSFFWKIFYLDAIWNKVFSEKINKKKTNGHFNFNTDHAFNDNLFLEKINSNIDLLSDSFSHPHHIYFNFLSYSKAYLCLDNFIYLHFSNIFYEKIDVNFKKTDNTIFKYLKKKFFIDRKGKKILFNYYLWPLKNKDLFFLNFWEKFPSYYFFLEKKIQMNCDLKWMFFRVFIKMSQIKFDKTTSFTMEKKEKDNFSNYLVWFVSRNQFEHILKKKLKNFSFFFFTFSKKKFFLELKKILRKIFFHLDLKGHIFVTTSTYFFSSFFVFEKYQKLVSLEIFETFREKFICNLVEFFSFYSQNPFFPREIFLKKKKYYVCMIKIFKKKLNETKSNLFISFFINYLSEKNKTIDFEIKFNSENFGRLILLFCAKYRIEKIFFQTTNSIQTRFLITLKNLILKKTKFLSKKTIKKNKKEKKAFLENIQLISFQKTSVLFKLDSMVSSHPDLLEKEKLLKSEIFNLLEQNPINFFSFLYGIKRQFYLDLSNDAFFLTEKELYKGFFFAQKKLLSEFYFPLENKKKNNVFKSILKYMCGLGERKLELLDKQFSDFYFYFKNIFDQKKKDEKLDIQIIKKNLLVKYFQEKKSSEKNHSKNNSFFLKSLRLFIIFFQHQANIQKSYTLLERKFPEILKVVESKKNNTNSSEVRKWVNLVKKTPFYFIFYKKFNVFSKIILSEISSPENIIFSLKSLNCVIENWFENDKKFYTKSWKSNIMERHQIGAFSTVPNPDKKKKKYFLGQFKTGIRFFIEKDDLFENKLQFENILNKNIINLPAKIVAIYPKLLKTRIKIVPEKNIFFPILKLKKNETFIKNQMKKKLFCSKFFTKVLKFKVFKKTDATKMNLWISSQKMGDWFFWNITKFYFLVSFIINPDKNLFFSFPIWIKLDRKIKKWIFIHKKNVFFRLNELFETFIIPFKFFLDKAILHENFSEENDLQLESKLKKKILEKKYFFFNFCFSEIKLGFFFIIVRFDGKYFKDYFHINHRGFNLKKKTFSSINSLKKYIFTSLTNQCKNLCKQKY